MTIVELYDRVPINNIIGALTFAPEKIVYVGGFSKKQFAAKKYPVLKKYLMQKQLTHTEIAYVQVRKDDLQDIVAKLETVYAENTDCRFNIEVTGGDDLILVAIGVLCQRHPEVKLFRISSKLRNITSFSLSNAEDNCKISVDFRNTVADNLILHGASVIDADGSDCLGKRGWGFDDAFIEQINIMWDVCCRDIPERFQSTAYTVHSYPNFWNKVTSALMAFDGMTDLREDPNVIRIDEQTYIEIADQYVGVEVFDSYLQYLMYRNLLMLYSEDGFVCIAFENDRIRSCLSKSGNILELKTFLICRELLDDYNGDVKVGVTVDWDGDVPAGCDPSADEEFNTINEIDVIATFGVTPCFISCKNGKFTSDELYKLSSVADRFGTDYAKKLVITTDMQYALHDNEEAMQQRAADMGIIIIDNVHRMTDAEWKDKLFAALELPKIKVKNS